MVHVAQEGAVHSPPVVLARNAITTYVSEGRVLSVPADPPAMLTQRAGAFVSLKKFGELRGCIGTIEPAYPTLAEEIIQNAISAATRDPRFFPVVPQEVPDLTISVDVLTPPERVSGLEDFDPQRYGMIVKSGTRRGLLLPALEGVDTPEQQYEIVCRKAGIRPGEPCEFYRFLVTRHH